MIERHDTQVRNTLSISSAFVVKEEEQCVLDNWTTDRAAKLISRQLWSRNTGPIVEKAIRSSLCCAVVFVKSAVKLVCSALSNQFYLATTASTFSSVGISRNSSEFLNRV